MIEVYIYVYVCIYIYVGFYRDDRGIHGEYMIGIFLNS